MTGKILALAVLSLSLCTLGLSSVEVEQRYHDGSGWKRPNPGPDATEIARVSGSWLIETSDTSNMWNTRVLTIRDLKVFAVKDVYPRLEYKLSITTPEYWDTVEVMDLPETEMTQLFDKRLEKTRIQSVHFAISANLKDRGIHNWLFKGFFIQSRNMLVGSVTLNGQPAGSFIATKKS